MNPRFRLLAALLALFAFSAYFAEGVWAAMCPPGTEAGSHAVAQVADAAAPGGAHAGHAGMHPTPAPDSEKSESSLPYSAPCPLGMPGAGGSCVAVSLPALAGEMQPAPVIHAPVVALLDTTHDQLLVAAHFRPPRA
jgi:hypothetical protein